MKEENSNNEFLNNLEYILLQLENDINKINNLEDKMYFELSKNELANYINDVYSKVIEWNSYYESRNYDLIINEYNKIESIISELELCIADYDEKFHMSGISYSLFQIGKILSNIMKKSDKNNK